MNPTRPARAPPPAASAESNLEELRRWLRDVPGKAFDGYDDLYRWSVAEPGEFWSALAEYFDILVPEQRPPALVASSMPGARWFPHAGRPVRDGVGELVVTQPMPSMPVGFWNDPDGSRYRAAGCWDVMSLEPAAIRMPVSSGRVGSARRELLNCLRRQ